MMHAHNFIFELQHLKLLFLFYFFFLNNLLISIIIFNVCSNIYLYIFYTIYVFFYYYICTLFSPVKQLITNKKKISRKILIWFGNCVFVKEWIFNLYNFQLNAFQNLINVLILRIWENWIMWKYLHNWWEVK